jgi:glycosyltransferase involved in cell wall biosynthesis
MLFPVGDVATLASALERLLGDKSLANKLGRAGQEQVKGEFRQEIIWKALGEEYRRLMQTCGESLPVVPVGKGVVDLVGRSNE